MLSKREFEKLMHDVKRASKAVGLIAEEKDKAKREVLASLISDELDRMYEDLEELKESGA